MSKKQLRYISFGCLVAMSANTVTGFAQGQAVSIRRAQDREQKVVVEEGLAGKAFDFVIADGQQATFSPAQGNFEVVSTGPNGTIGFIAGEMSFDTEVVKGMPFSAVAVNETTQTLSDGNRIVRKTSSNIFRDSEGRTRRETSLGSVGPWTSNSNTAQRVFINDPVGGTSYVLDPVAQTAQKNSMPQLRLMAGAAAGGVMTTRATVAGSAAGAPVAGVAVAGTQVQAGGSGGTLRLATAGGAPLKRVQPEYPAVAKAAGAQGLVQVQVTLDSSGRVIAAEATSGHPLLRQAAIDAAKQWQFSPVADGGKLQATMTFNFVLDKASTERAVATAAAAGGQHTYSFDRMAYAGGEKVEFKREALGKQKIEGVEAEGSRTVTTIPQGAVGNERPIEIISERWYSPELKTVVLTRHSDPRSGESVYRLENINRTEPSAGMFQVPTEYTVTSEPARIMRRTVPDKP